MALTKNLAAPAIFMVGGTMGGIDRIIPMVQCVVAITVVGVKGIAIRAEGIMGMATVRAAADEKTKFEKIAAKVV
ncbi:MAG TPA: hypothetical protein VEL47_01025 [Myxococcota bacterium]|nr:hypothetical protein [Myxococcota bacterium]